LKTDEQSWVDSAPGPHGASLAQGQKRSGRPVALTRCECTLAGVTTRGVRALARPSVARDATRWGVVARRAGGVPGECVDQDKRRRGSPRSPDTGGVEEKLWGSVVPTDDGAPISRRSMLGVPAAPGR
jgi:hypothetical protein